VEAELSVNATAGRILEVRAMHWDNDHMDGSWAVLMMLGMLIFWSVVVVAVIWAVHSAKSSNMPSAGSQTSRPGGRGGDAENILANRLARGEIDAEGYQSRLTVLRSTKR
jgi:putative membrane protein